MEVFKNLEKSLEDYYKQKDKINSRSRELNNSIEEDTAQIAKLQKDYETAIVSLDEKQADAIHEQIFELKKRVSNSSQKYTILNSNDPNMNLAIKKIATDFVQAASGSFEEVNIEIAKIAEEVKSLQKTFVDKLIELESINSYAESFESDFSGVAKKADPEALKDLGIHPRLGEKRFKKVSPHSFFVGQHNYLEIRKGN